MSLHDPETRAVTRPASEKVMDLRGLNPAPVTVFKKDGQVDYEQNAKLARWLVSVEGVKSLVILGHAGEGTFLTQSEQVKLIECLVDCGSAWKRDPVSGVIGVEKGPLILVF